LESGKNINKIFSLSFRSGQVFLASLHYQVSMA
jgi:hypothetical protein